MIILTVIILLLSFREGQPPTINKTANAPCDDLPSKATIEQALTGVLCKSIALRLMINIIENPDSKESEMVLASCFKATCQPVCDK